MLEPLAPVKIGSSFPVDRIKNHIRLATMTGLKGVAWDSVSGAAVICGNGPSLNWAKIPEDKPIVALNGALRVLLDRNIVPKYAVCYDPQPNNAGFYELAPKKTTYLIGSRCHPGVFKALRKNKVRIWHIADSPEIEAGIADKLIAGGDTVGLKAPNLLYGMGFQKFELIGYDSCLMFDGRHHASPQPWNDGEKIHTVEVMGRSYRATAWMIAQAQQAIEQFGHEDCPFEVQIHGAGLVRAMMEQAMENFNGE